MTSARPASAIKRTRRHVLFICTGNYYRSRFAEGVFNHLASERRMPWRAFSRGLAIHLVSGDISPHTAMALFDRAIDLSHTGRTRVTLTEEDLRKADRVIALKEAEHRPMIAEKFPEWADKIEYWSVHDLDRVGPEEALPAIERKVRQLVDALSPRRGSHAG